jgi:hypothetical protein
MARNKRLPENVRPVNIMLTPAEKLVLSVIEARRQERREERDSPSEIVSDALWQYLTDVEKMTREQIESLLPKIETTDNSKSKISTIPHKRSR